MGRFGMSARHLPVSSGPSSGGGAAGGGGGGGAGVYTEETFNYTGGRQNFDTSKTNGQPITAYVFGPGGGAEGDTNTRGGAGGYSEGTISINAGGTLRIIVGGHGGPGRQNNGSGAGYSGVFAPQWAGNSVGTDHGASIIIAGGGGGSANSSSGSQHGAGAGGGSSGQRGNPSNSGGIGGSQGGGGSYRQTGGGSCTSGSQCSGQQLRGGVACGGGEGSGGVGWPNQIYGGNYASAAGGNGCNAGGGGAGYYGGAGGASSPNGGNGGGGSGYIGGHPSYPVSGASTVVGSGDQPSSTARNSPFYSGQISYGGRHSHNRGNGSHQGGSGKVVIAYYAPGSGGGSAPSFSYTDYTAIDSTSPQDIAYRTFSGQSFLAYITQFGVNQNSSNNDNSQWDNGYSGQLSYSGHFKQNGGYFTTYNQLRYIHGDGSSDGGDWVVIDFGPRYNGDFDGYYRSQQGRYMGGENTSSGGGGGIYTSTSHKIRLWGFNSTVGWKLLYQHPMGVRDYTYSHRNANWWNSGSTTTSGDGKRPEYDSMSLEYVAFSVGYQ